MVGSNGDQGAGGSSLAEYAGRMWSALGKGGGFTAIALTEVTAGFVLGYYSKDLVGFATILGAVNAGFYGGGAWKAAAEAKNGGSKNGV